MILCVYDFALLLNAQVESRKINYPRLWALYKYCQKTLESYLEMPSKPLRRLIDEADFANEFVFLSSNFTKDVSHDQP